MFANTLDEDLRSWKTVLALPLIDLQISSHFVASSSEYSSNKFLAIVRSFRVLITPKAWMKSAAGGMSSARKGCMESRQRRVCYQSEGEGEYALKRDAILRGAQITYNGLCPLIAYQSFGLDKKLSNPIGLLNFLVETTGIEPVTPCMSSKYSNQLSYASVPDYYSTYFQKKQELFYSY